MKYLGCLFFRDGAILVDPIEQFSVFAKFHEDVYLIVFFDHLVDLRDVLMHQIFLQLYLSLDRLDLVSIVGLYGGDLDCHSLSCWFVDGFFHFSETAFTDDLFLIIGMVLSS